MFLPVLLRCDSVLAPERLDKVAAIRKAGLLADVVQVKIRKKQEILCLAQPDKFNVFLAGLPIEFPEALGKIGIAHVADGGKILDLDRFVRMCINVFGDRVDRILGIRQGKRLVGVKAQRTPFPQDMGKQCIDMRLDHDPVAIFLCSHFLNTVRKKMLNRTVRKTNCPRRLLLAFALLARTTL